MGWVEIVIVVAISFYATWFLLKFRAVEKRLDKLEKKAEQNTQD